ncbi:ABC transporter ATP-binding protein [Prosthecochloris sp. N3]|uniref:ABC transporter ATP-binding protein n=1 Tax=Prosthecochloris ethylica TaxID=2743976 RepID=A0ABR9XPT7_9CHLB|nr:ABC transporter ATP-binding protein [Prosthecochloris ethylica]MBF0587255.1 ABC transporter ATP-binding protein [Prosthecochloris ethylica]MBF0636051.1 ABC transporter ATP-binding protein [Prosthecochloris ethylica]NUK48478.1 ABC transporter ATP-binding protein [Prosthecochloris ethylica]
MSDAAAYATFKQTYETGKEIAGKYQHLYTRSLLFYSFSFINQGLAYLSIYLIFVALFSTPVETSAALIWLALFAVFTCLSGISRWFAHDFDYTGTLPRVMHGLRMTLGDKLRTMPLERLGRYKTGELNASLSSNVDESVTMLGMISGMFLDVVITPLVVVTGLFFIDWRMAVIVMVMMPLAIPLYKRKRQSGMAEKSDMGRANAALESNIIEYIQGLAVLRATNQTGANAKRLYEGIIHVRDLQKSTIVKTTTLMLVLDALILVTLIVIGFLGSLWVGDATMSVAAVAAVLVMVSRLMEPMSIFLAITAVMDIMAASFKRVKEVLAVAPLDVEEPQAEISSYDVEFRSVDFRYHGQEDMALKGVSVRIPGQSMTAFVGPSGSGKTTMTKLMMRYADPQKGVIEIGGADIRHMSQGYLLSMFSVVFQDVYLFDESIIENIRIAKPGASDEEVRDAARAAHCHEFIERLPDGYDTGVGDIGGSLSGGERQRISIARAILKDAPIVILDEPTAALDTESEVAVQNAIDKLVEDKTVIVIAHRLSTISGADNILVIDKGEIVESGKHDELIAKGGKYFNLWSAQQRVKEWHISA